MKGNSRVSMGSCTYGLIVAHKPVYFYMPGLQMLVGHWSGPHDAHFPQFWVKSRHFLSRTAPERSWWKAGPNQAWPWPRAAARYLGAPPPETPQNYQIYTSDDLDAISTNFSEISFIINTFWNLCLGLTLQLRKETAARHHENCLISSSHFPSTTTRILPGSCCEIGGH